MTGAYEAHSSRSVHSHPSVERAEWWSSLVEQMTALYAPLGRRGRRPRRPVGPPRCFCGLQCAAEAHMMLLEKNGVFSVAF